MDIKIGRIETPGDRGRGESRGGPVEAKVLAVRKPRQRVRERRRGDRERRASPDRDPVNGRVLVLMVPDGRMLPGDLDTARYRVLLRFARS